MVVFNNDEECMEWLLDAIADTVGTKATFIRGSTSLYAWANDAEDVYDILRDVQYQLEGFEFDKGVEVNVETINDVYQILKDHPELFIKNELETQDSQPQPRAM